LNPTIFLGYTYQAFCFQIVFFKRALSEIKIEGIESSVLFHQVALDDEVFRSGRHTTDFVEDRDIIKKVQEQVKILRRLDNR